MADHTIEARFEVKTNTAAAQSPVSLEIPQEVLRAAAAAIRDTPPSGDQAWYEANKILRALSAASEVATALARPRVNPVLPSAVDQAADDVRNFGTGFVKVSRDEDGNITREHVPLATVADLRPTLEPAELVPSIETADTGPEMGAPETLEDQEAAQAAERAAQDAEIAANVAAASPLDAPQTGKGSRKAKVSRLDGQGTGGEVSKLDAGRTALIESGQSGTVLPDGTFVPDPKG